MDSFGDDFLSPVEPWKVCRIPSSGKSLKLETTIVSISFEMNTSREHTEEETKGESRRRGIKNFKTQKVDETTMICQKISKPSMLERRMRFQD